MKTIKKISAFISKAAEMICILMIAGLVVVIIMELINRNILDSSNRATIEICGIEFLWMAFISLLLGVVMVIAFIAQYPYVSTRFYSTFTFPLAYTIQYVPMCIAGAYIAFETLVQLADHVITLAAGRSENADGREKA